MIKIFCGFAICLLMAFCVLCGYRYKAEQCFDKGRRLLDKKQYEAAFLPLMQAVKYNPFCLLYRNTLGVFTLKLALDHKDLDLLGRAIKNAEITTNMYPEHYYSYYTMAQGYDVLGKKELAIKYYKKAMVMHPYLPVIRKKLNSIL